MPWPHRRPQGTRHLSHRFLSPKTLLGLPSLWYIKLQPRPWNSMRICSRGLSYRRHRIRWIIRKMGLAEARRTNFGPILIYGIILKRRTWLKKRGSIKMGQEISSWGQSWVRVSKKINQACKVSKFRNSSKRGLKTFFRKEATCDLLRILKIKQMRTEKRRMALRCRIPSQWLGSGLRISWRVIQILTMVMTSISIVIPHIIPISTKDYGGKLS